MYALEDLGLDFGFFFPVELVLSKLKLKMFSGEFKQTFFFLKKSKIGRGKLEYKKLQKSIYRRTFRFHLVCLQNNYFEDKTVSKLLFK